MLKRASKRPYIKIHLHQFENSIFGASAYRLEKYIEIERSLKTVRLTLLVHQLDSLTLNQVYFRIIDILRIPVFENFGKIVISRFKSNLPLSVLTALFIVACEAPHSNPFDPRSTGYKPAQPPIAITDLAVEEITESTALLTWTAPVGAIAYLLYHDSPGWDGRSPQTAMLYSGSIPGVMPAGSSQSIVINLPSSDDLVWAIFSRSEPGLLSLGSNPVTISPPPRDRIGIVSAKATSIFQSSWSPPDLIELRLDAAISDSDGVDSVWATTNLGSLGKLLLTGDEITWSTLLPEYETPTGVLEHIVGHPILIHYSDLAGFVSQSQPIFLSRVIYAPPIIDSPNDNDTLTSPNPRLSWYAHNAEYVFTYGIDIDFVSVPSYDKSSVYRKYLISSDSAGHTVEDSLSSHQGFYIWTLSVKDDLGNMAYSTESKFWILNGE